jgi:DNA-binding NtrC family response regulator
MNDLVALTDRKSKGWTEVESRLEALDFQVHLAGTLAELQTLIIRTGCRVVILDLDVVQIPNRFFRSLKKGNPGMTILVTSSRPFHPHLKESMTHHICACFRKPIEHEEIEYWLKAVVSRSPARDPTIGTEQ